VRVEEVVAGDGAALGHPDDPEAAEWRHAVVPIRTGDTDGDLWKRKMYFAITSGLI
jgi:hypothetical protein